MSNIGGMDGDFTATSRAGAALASVHKARALPQNLHPLALRKHLHDLSNSLTGMLGNLELVELSREDSELDVVSLEAAGESARAAMRIVRELKGEIDQHLATDTLH